MKVTHAFIAIIAILGITACSSKQQMASTQTKSTLNTVYYKNQIIKKESVATKAAPVVQVQSNHGVTNKGSFSTAVSNKNKVGALRVMAKKADVHNTSDKLDEAVLEQPIAERTSRSEEERMDRAGRTGLVLSLIGVALVVLGATPEALFLAVIGGIVMLFALFFSVKGLNGKNKNAAIAGLVISGVFTLSALILAMVYLVQNI